MPKGWERLVRWIVGLVALAVLALIGTEVVRWATDPGPPLGDERACAGTGVPLRQALAVTGLDLPAGAQDVHYLAQEDPATGRVSLSLVLRTTRSAMTDYLASHGIAVDRPGSLDDPRYSRVDTGMDPDLCGGVLRTPAVLLPLPAGDGTTANAVVELDDSDAIRADTTVIMHASTR
ncbi:hypothetical protein Kpho02_36980 [Kitasatospora phosalacinea]|uniref:Uncharacterized protein n=1 Tax=Kitasatospora phosalacinea TaxID=2065 RepID=A0A9W6Q7Y1_9ACTN|nr:hypothetical protein [Kitasatospora phosalacinea]GLW71399.1 hypothetical protein Kpho02_36980 [Kitasatospora phosalacinea]